MSGIRLNISLAILFSFLLLNCQDNEGGDLEMIFDRYLLHDNYDHRSIIEYDLDTSFFFDSQFMLDSIFIKNADFRFNRLGGNMTYYYNTSTLLDSIVISCIYDFHHQKFNEINDIRKEVYCEFIKGYLGGFVNIEYLDQIDEEYVHKHTPFIDKIVINSDTFISEDRHDMLIELSDGRYDFNRNVNFITLSNLFLNDKKDRALILIGTKYKAYKLSLDRIELFYKKNEIWRKLSY